MELKKYKVGNDKFEFVCETYSNSYSWGHIVTLFRNNCQIGEAKIRYYNRTWESFCYQSCMLKVISEKIENLIYWHLEDYKRKKNITRFKKGEKEKAIEEYKKKSLEYKHFKKIYEEIHNGI